VLYLPCDSGDLNHDLDHDDNQAKLDTPQRGSREVDAHDVVACELDTQDIDAWEVGKHHEHHCNNAGEPADHHIDDQRQRAQPERSWPRGDKSRSRRRQSRSRRSESGPGPRQRQRQVSETEPFRR
jgi:hypothetical protein